MRQFDYEQEARRCREAAERAASTESRLFMETMAQVWEQIAGDTATGRPREAPAARSSGMAQVRSRA